MIEPLAALRRRFEKGRSVAVVELPPRKVTPVMSLMQVIESLTIQDDDQTADLILLAFNSELLIKSRLLNIGIQQAALFDRAGVRRVAAMLAAHGASIERTRETTASRIGAAVVGDELEPQS